MVLTLGRREAKASAKPSGEEAPLLRRRMRRFMRVSPLTLRILAVNMLALAILVVGLLYLGQYQDNLIQSQLEALKGDARVFAGMVAEGGTVGDLNGQFALSPRPARSVIRRWVDATAVRTRLFDPQGAFFADSQTLDGPNGTNIDWRLLPPPHSFNTKVEAFFDFLSRQLNTWPGRAKLREFKESNQHEATDY